MIRALDPTQHTQVLAHLLSGLMTNKMALMKLQSTKVELAPPSVILDLLSTFLLNFNPSHVEWAAS